MNPTITHMIDQASLYAGHFLNKLEASMTLLGYSEEWLHILWLTIGVGMLVVACALEAYGRLGLIGYRWAKNWLRARRAARQPEVEVIEPEIVEEAPRVIVFVVPFMPEMPDIDAEWEYANVIDGDNKPATVH